MTGKELIALTMCYQVPDRVPVMCQLSIGHYNLNGGYKPDEIWYETEAFADACVKLARRYAFDGILVAFPGRPPNYLDNVVRISEENDGKWLTWRNGSHTFMPWDDMPHHYPENSTKPVRAEFETFDPDRDFCQVHDYLGYVWNVLFHMQEVPGKPDHGLLVSDAVPPCLFQAFDIVKDVRMTTSRFMVLSTHRSATTSNCSALPRR